MCLVVPGRQGKYIFTQESFCLQGIVDNINEQETSFLDCKHKHMMKSRAQHDKFGVLGPVSQTFYDASYVLNKVVR